VLLLEWRGRRLLFAGDAEWKGTGVKKGQRNGCWDVMFRVDEAHGHLSRPLDFLKVGHHGSVNGTPFVDKAGAPQPVLDRLLPVGGQAQVVVSTLAGEHGEKKVVLSPDLMEGLGRRAANACPYPNDYAQPDVPQPPAYRPGVRAGGCAAAGVGSTLGAEHRPRRGCRPHAQRGPQAAPGLPDCGPARVLFLDRREDTDARHKSVFSRSSIGLSVQSLTIIGPSARGDLADLDYRSSGEPD